MTFDTLKPLFEHFKIQAHTFFTGVHCGEGSIQQSRAHGYLHFIRQGRGEVRYPGHRPALPIDGPTLLFYPRNLPHQLVSSDPGGLDLVCARVTFGTGISCPLAQELPEVMRLGIDEIGPIADLLFAEAFGKRNGRHAVVNRLCEVVIVEFVRMALEQGHTKVGLLMGLGNPYLRDTLTAVHADPSRAWSLIDMATLAGMSRSGFAKLFKQTLGVTPGEHVMRFRVAKARELLGRGVSVKLVAYEVGYGSSAAFARVFQKIMGESPRAWLKTQKI